MRKAIVVLVILSLILGLTPAFAAREGQKGASERAYERASPRAIFHRVSDWFATRGKSPKEKEAIIVERKAKREADRAEKEAKKALKKAEKQQRMMEKEARKMQKKASKSMRGRKK